jgi:C4-dicarboxylate transporter DctM subunit
VTAMAAARIGFSALVYALSFFFVWMILTFFVAPEWEGVTFAGRSNLAGLAISLVVMVAYGLWREKASNPREPAALSAGFTAGLGAQPCADGPEFAGPSSTKTRKVMVDSSKTIIMLMFIIVNALLFAHVLTSERIPRPSPTG